MRGVVRLILFAVAGSAASFLLSEVHPFGNPGSSAILSSGEQLAEIPLEVRAVLNEKCADCHSMRTRLPLYGYFAPASWLIERDVIGARGAMDLSRWQSYSPEEQETLKAKIAHEVRRRDMPPPQYLAMHWTARITDSDLQAITRWGTSSPIIASSGALPESSMDGDAERGRVVFEKRCTGCHALTQDREGPHLQGVYGRVSGTVPGFDYSPALRNAKIVWDSATLDRWLTDPDAFVPGNNMDFHVTRPQERTDLIRFLRQQSQQ